MGNMMRLCRLPIFVLLGLLFLAPPDMRPAEKQPLEKSAYFAFVDRERQGFLAVDILVRLQRVDCDFRMPMIGRSNDDDVNVLVVERLAIVSMNCGFATKALFGAGTSSTIDVANGQHITIAGCSSYDCSTPPAVADERDSESIVL